MLKRIAHIALSVCLGILLIFGDTSKEFIHLFADHTDTVHCHSNTDGLVIESQHHHCTFLSFSLTPFANDLQFPYVEQQRSVIYLTPLYTAVTTAIYSTDIHVGQLRGPPVA